MITKPLHDGLQVFMVMTPPHTSFNSSLFCHGHSKPFLAANSFIAINHVLTVFWGLSLLSWLAGIFFLISWKFLFTLV